MELYLVQHGAAKTEAEDPERSLTEEGRRTVARTAEFLSRLGLGLDRIEHSGKRRARETAEILEARLKSPVVEQKAGLGPNDDVEPLCQRLSRESGRLMVVGHLPYLARLVARLVGAEPDRAPVRFEMGGVVRLDRDSAGRWMVRWALPPELVAAYAVGAAAKAQTPGD